MLSFGYVERLVYIDCAFIWLCDTMVAEWLRVHENMLNLPKGILLIILLTIVLSGYYKIIYFRGKETQEHS